MSVLKIKNENNEWESVPVINGEDGFSPTITTSKVGKETTLTITDVNGTSTATILDGEGGTGSGDMAKATYDTNDNGIVDNAEKVNNHTVLSDVPANAVFTDTTYTAGTGIAINNGVISNTQTSAEWGNITGTLSDQTDLQNALDSVEGIETLTGTEQEPVSLNTLEPGVYILKGYVQRGSSTDNLNSFYPEGRIYVLSPYSASTGGSRIVYSTNPRLSDVNIMTDFWRINRSGNMYASTGVKNLISNIKTINNQSLLGSGNITIEGGSGASVWGSITGTLSNQTDLKNTLDSKADANDIPTKVSDLTNDAGFITNTVNNLTNYYTKSNTYTKTEVDNLIGSMSSLNIQIVQTLPTQDISTSTIYLVPKTASTNDNYDEYIYVSNSWEHIGSTEVDLSNYYTKTQTDNLLNDKADANDIPTKVSDLTNDAGYTTFSGNYNDLTNKPTIPTVNNATLTIQKNGSTVKTFKANASSNVTANITVPTKTSDLTNDSGFITSYTETDPVFNASAAKNITTSDITNWNNKSTFSGSYNDLTNKPTIPDSTSDLTNDSGFITKSVNNLTNYYTKTTIDSSLSSKQDSLVSGTNIKTINNQSLLGSGDLSINTYSTTEQRVGTWKDGKPLYRITLEYSVSTGSSSHSVSSLNIDNIAKQNHQIKRYGSGVEDIEGPFYGTSTDYFRSFVRKNTNTIETRLQGSYPKYTQITTLEYTKTTD